MKLSIAMACPTLVAAPCLTVPTFAAAQYYRSYGTHDPCWAAKRRAGANGAVTGGIVGAVLGSAIAGRGSRFGGAVLGGTVGAVAGHAVARSSVRCAAYPRRLRPRLHCRWVEQDAGGVPRQFELCRGADGVWRPSGR